MLVLQCRPRCPQQHPALVHHPPGLQPGVKIVSASYGGPYDGAFGKGYIDMLKSKGIMLVTAAGEAGSTVQGPGLLWAAGPAFGITGQSRLHEQRGSRGSMGSGQTDGAPALPVLLNGAELCIHWFTRHTCSLRLLTVLATQATRGRMPIQCPTTRRHTATRTTM